MWDHSYLREPLSQPAGRHRVVLPDVRGCGRSTQGLGDARYTPDTVLLIHGRHDMRFAASAAQRAAAFLPRARAVVLEGAGHMAHVDQPLAWLQAIAGFLE